MKIKLLIDHGGKKAGEEMTVSPKWAQYALAAGLAVLPDKKSKKKSETEPEKKPETEAPKEKE